MYILRAGLIILWFSSVACEALSQNENSFAGGVFGTWGDLIKIHGEYPDNGFSTIGEVNVAWQTSERKEWMIERGLPVLGFSCMLADFGNRRILGRAYGIVPQFMRSWPLGSSYFYIRGGLGVAYFDKSYDISENPGNLVFGSMFSNMSNLFLGIGRPMGRSLSFEVGVSVVHASNAHVRVPNIGGNVVGLHAGLRFGSQHRQARGITCSPIRDSLLHWFPVVQAGYGLHSFPGTIRPIGGPLYSVYGVSLYATQRTKKQAVWSAGMHFHYYRGYEQYSLLQELFESSEARRTSHVLIAFAGREWFFGRFSFFLQAGVNLYSPFLRKLNEVWDLPKHGWMYLNTAHKVGYRVYVDDRNTYLGISVKSNGGTADMIEFSLGRLLTCSHR